MTAASFLRVCWLPGPLAAFGNDRWMLESQAANMALAPPKAMLTLIMDKALVRYRRLCERAIDTEAQSPF